MCHMCIHHYRYFTNAETSKHTKDALMAEVRKMEEMLRKTTSEASEPREGTSSESAASEPAKKTPRVDAASKQTCKCF